VERRPLEPAVDPEEAWDLWGLIHGHEVRVAQAAPLRAAPALLCAGAWLGWALRFGPGRMARGVARGWRLGERGYLRARARREEVARAFEERLAGLDAWLMPVWPVTAPAHQRTGAPVPVDGRPVVYSDALGAYQCPTVTLGCPALALPAGRAGDGLPVGVQLLAPRHHDWRLLRVARAVEEARGPWTGLAPLEG
jgi:Asp-tRNA(Asn)/Glu-tRNA(Gln) amidotransferase A subunit family amidase